MFQSQKDVIEFMRAATQAVPDEPGIPDEHARILRVKLIAQELRELAQAYGVRLVMDSNQPEDGIVVVPEARYAPNLRDAYDATLDIQYVTVGSGIAMGLDLQPGWEEVQRTNMQKFVGGHRAKDGKWIKPANWAPPNLQAIIDRQIEAAKARKKQQALL